jgi:hypothetical protein
MKFLLSVLILINAIIINDCSMLLANEMVVKGVGGNGTSIRNTGTEKDVEAADNHPA